MLAAIVTSKSNAQKLYYSDDEIEAQLIALIGDSTNRTLRPVIKFRPKNKEHNRISIKNPRAWDKYGYIYASLDAPFYTFKTDNEIWTKANCEEYFRVENWKISRNTMDTVSVLTIDFSCIHESEYDNYHYDDQYKMMIFYDVPILWETPVGLPDRIAKMYGAYAQKDVGVYHPYNGNGNGFRGSIRLESVVADRKSGKVLFIMQVKSESSSAIYIEKITINYKGELVRFGSQLRGEKHTITPGQWCEIAVVGCPEYPVCIYPDEATKMLEYLEIQIGKDYTTKPYIARSVPIQWVTFPEQKSNNNPTNKTTTVNKPKTSAKKSATPPKNNKKKTTNPLLKR